MADEAVVGGGVHDPDAHVEADDKGQSKKVAPKEPYAAKLTRAPRIVVDNKTARSDDDAYEGALVKITHGDYKGEHGVFLDVLDYDEKSGYPTECLVRLKDTSLDADLVKCEYGWLRNYVQGGTR